VYIHRSGLRHRANPRIELVTQEAGNAAQSAITAQNAAGVAQKKTDAADISAKNAIGDAQSAHGEAKAASTAAGTAEASATATGKKLEAVEIQLPPRRSDLALAVHTTSRVLHAIADRLLVYIQSVGEPVAAGIVARMRWENVKDFLSRNRSSAVDEVEEVEPRSLSEREASWINDIRRVVSDWRDADLSGTRVVAEGANAEGYSLFLRGSKPENPHSTSSHGILGQLWIETEDRLKINVQLFQWEGHLRELYVLVLDSTGRNVRLPSAWIEVSRKAVNG
jgi:hypothetical protein